MKRSLSICIILVCLSFGIARGNGIVLSNITSVNGAGFVQLQFDLTWNNSWFNAINRDAAWVFFKFKDNDGTWHHLNLTNANNVISADFTIQVPTDLTGAFIYRNTGLGNNSILGVQLGVTNLPGSFDVKGFAIEMVQLPMDDTYNVGDGQATNFYRNGSTVAPFLVNANTITMGTTAGLLNDPVGNGTLATGFPIGYNIAGASLNLYMMKHELSQAAYRDFLNTLTYTQQVSRTAVLPNLAAGTLAIGTVLTYRNGIKISTSGVASTTPAVYGCDLNNNAVYNETTDGEWVACNFLTYMDLAAFLDWAALRPMTELEFEKSCRGPLSAVAAEYAAGTAASATSVFGQNNWGAANESYTYSGSVLNANITHNAASGSRITRVGIHATASATRISAGAGYYGALDLSGNIQEYCVITGNAAGRSFTGINGNGDLNSAGDADVNYWPGINGNIAVIAANTAYGGTTGVTGAAGIFTRGGGTGWVPVNAQTSTRNDTPATTSVRTTQTGGRGVKNW